MVSPDDPTPRARAGGRPRPRFAIPVLLAAILTALGAFAVATGAFAGTSAPGPIVPRAAPILPDLAMGPIGDIAVGTTDVQDQRLRFSATIVNIGAGPFLLGASRPWIGEGWSVEQYLLEPDGSYSVRPTTADLVFGGDGHDHWHVRQVEVHQLETMDGEILGRLVKQGFCFFDTDAYRTSLPGAPAEAHWGSSGCADQLDTRVHMGLSIGWGDEYPWNLLDERIDVTGIPDGRYRIRQIADPNGEFEESDETNNETWVVVELTATPDGLRETTVVEAGPAP